MLRIRIRDPVPFWPLDPGSGIGKKSGSWSGMNNPDHISKCSETIFWVKILNSLMRIWGRKLGSGIRDGKISVPDKYLGSATPVGTGSVFFHLSVVLDFNNEHLLDREMHVTMMVNKLRPVLWAVFRIRPRLDPGSIGSVDLIFADPLCLSRIRIFPSRILSKKDTGSRICNTGLAKNLSILNPKNCSRKYDTECLSRIRFFPLWIPVKKFHIFYFAEYSLGRAGAFPCSLETVHRGLGIKIFHLKK